MAIYRDLPADLRRPCDEPDWAPVDIVTDVDLLGLLNRYRWAYACTAAKIRAIDRIYAGVNASANHVGKGMIGQ